MSTSNYSIFVDATADYIDELKNETQIIPMQLMFQNESVQYDHQWDEKTLMSFYSRLRNGDVPSTSQITPFSYEQAFESCLQDGQDIFYLCLSSGLSNTVSSVELVKNNLEAKYSGRRIMIFDTKHATYGVGNLLEAAVKNRAAGMSLEENISDLQKVRAKQACWFTVSDLMYLRHGGRISSAAAVVGMTFHIMPIIRVDEQGKLPVVDKVQGRKTAIRYLMQRFLDTADCPQKQRVIVIQGDAIEDARLLEKMLKKAVPDIGEVRIVPLGAIIGAHTGPGTLGIAFREK